MTSVGAGSLFQLMHLISMNHLPHAARGKFITKPGVARPLRRMAGHTTQGSGYAGFRNELPPSCMRQVVHANKMHELK